MTLTGPPLLPLLLNHCRSALRGRVQGCARGVLLAATGAHLVGSPAPSVFRRGDGRTAAFLPATLRTSPAVPLLRTLELLFDPTTICYANNFTVLVLKVSYLATFGFT
ncbi:hypothetical protein M422DRAFT_251741 [Sphaerobolus stellatus SS14]|uniref:Uncharacterized protein n=1 Tax=Sphaerobolus stellatus (strain SS14) TaxID=990650 RepID=A0A0C9W1B3_SPHS4|nr:hypothetical protein M422DRAFT_251741 [Sphaerobolus stellatus SS14]